MNELMGASCGAVHASHASRSPSRALSPMIAVLTVALMTAGSGLFATSWKVVDMGQDETYPGSSASHPAGQDADYDGAPFSYTVSSDGLTIYDNNTGLTWTRAYMEDATHAAEAWRFTWDEAEAYAVTLNAAAYGGITTWRLPLVKELYSLMDFRGSSTVLRPYLLESDPDTGDALFEFRWGDADGDGVADGDGDPATPDGDEWTDLDGDGVADVDEWIGWRVIDAQYWTASKYVGLTYADNQTVFGVNFGDGRIKGYCTKVGPDGMPPDVQHAFVRYVSGPLYGLNQFVNNEDGTITDNSTGLMWTRVIGNSFEWEQALDFAEGLTYAGHDNWRLPNIKELQGIVDYFQAPLATDPSQQGPALDELFFAPLIPDVIAGTLHYPPLWSSTTHLESLPPQPPPGWTDDDMGACYVSIGQAWGWDKRLGWVDVHGAGAQRSDPKFGKASEFPPGCAASSIPCGAFGPQNDLISIRNGVVCVREP